MESSGAFTYDFILLFLFSSEVRTKYYDSVIIEHARQSKDTTTNNIKYKQGYLIVIMLQSCELKIVIQRRRLERSN